MYDNVYYDIIILDEKGDLVYSVYKELDYGANVDEGGEFGDAGLGLAFRYCIQRPREVFETPWEPCALRFVALASFVSIGILDTAGNVIALTRIENDCILNDFFTARQDELNSLMSLSVLSLRRIGRCLSAEASAGRIWNC